MPICGLVDVMFSHNGATGAESKTTLFCGSSPGGDIGVKLAI